jgi:tetratricopeptide (TPR) repeat protein
LLDEYDVAPLNGMATALAHKQEFEKAIDYCNKVISIDKNNRDALTTLGSIYRTLEKYPTALKYLNKSLIIKYEKVVEKVRDMTIEEMIQSK